VIKQGWVAQTAARCQAATPAAPFPGRAASSGMDDDRGSGYRGGPAGAGPPQAALPGLRPAAAAVGPGSGADGPGAGRRGRGGAPGPCRCTGCGVTHVVLDAGLLPRRSYTAALIGQALVAAALGRGHRLIARDLAVPHGTVRGWIRRDRRSADQLRIAGIRAVVALDPDALPARARPDELGDALDALWAAAMAMGDRFGLQGSGLWARITGADPGPAAGPVPGRLTRPSRSGPRVALLASSQF
jgi:hypothetical protein